MCDKITKDKLQSRCCDPAGNFSTTPFTIPLSNIRPADDNDKTTGDLPPLSPVAISNQKGNVQETDLKLASSSSQSRSAPAITLTPDEDEELFGKTNADWKVETHKMSARVQLEAYLQSPHTLQECVDTYSQFTSGCIYNHISRMKSEGVIVEFDNKTLVMTK